MGYDTETFITFDSFGKYQNWDPCESCPDIAEGQAIKRYTMENRTGVRVTLIEYGATITSIEIPDNNGVLEDVLLGFDDAASYREDFGHYLGVTLGRHAGVISSARFKLGDKKYCLVPNYGIHHRHGGCHGFDKALWQSHIKGNSIIMTYSSCDEEEGYPGFAFVQVEFSLTDDSCLIISSSAVASLPTPLNIGHVLYFNLAGQGGGEERAGEHVLEVNADRVLSMEEGGIPTGNIDAIGGTLYDVRIPCKVEYLKTLWAETSREVGNVTYCLTKGDNSSDAVCLAARLHHPGTGRCVEIKTNHAALQVDLGSSFPGTPNPEDPVEYDPDLSYLSEEIELGEAWSEEHLTGLVTPPPSDHGTNSSASADNSKKRSSDRTEKTVDSKEYSGEDMEDDDGSIVGKAGSRYKYGCAVGFMASAYPDSIHHENFPPSILYPGQTYSKTVVYRFLVVPTLNTMAPDQLLDHLAEEDDFDVDFFL